MKSLRLNKIVNQISSLNNGEFRLLKENINKIESKKIVAKTLETNIKELCCAHCKSREFNRWGKQNDLQRYKCKKCLKTFNSLSGTPLARLKRKGHWLEYATCLRQGKTIRSSAFICGIAKSTSFRWRHRFLVGTNSIMPNNLFGIIEILDISKKISFKGSRNIPEKLINPRKEIYVLFGRDRSGKTINHVLDEFTNFKVANKISSFINKDSLICTDNKEQYFSFSNSAKLRHGFIDIKNNMSVKKDIIHLKNINRYHENLEKWMSRFYGVATKYLRNYLSWYRGLEEKNMRLKAVEILLRAKTKI